MIHTTDANLQVLSKLENFVLVAHPEHVLVLSFLMWVITIKLDEAISLTSLEQVKVDFLGLFHELPHAVNRVIIDRGVILSSCL